MSAKLLSLPALYNLLENAAKPMVLVIDGMAGAGKTTLAEDLSRNFSCCTIHMDDFFLPFEMRTPERLAQPGGNVHYERLISEVLPYLHTDFSYRIFDCGDGSMEKRRHVPLADITIIEGSYSLHPALGRAYDLSLFLEISPAEQSRRIAQRGGIQALHRFQELWIPLENRYFQEYNIKKTADYLLR